MNKQKNRIRGGLILALILLGLTSFTILPGQFSRGAGLETEMQRSKATMTAQPTSPGSLLQGTDQQALGRMDEAYGKQPLSFETNYGQTSPEVKFLSRQSSSNLFLTADEAILVLEKLPSKGKRQQNPTAAHRKAGPAGVLRLKLLGSNPGARLEGLDLLPGKSNYFRGNQPDNWQTAIPNYAKVQYSEIYKGINLLYYGNQRQLEYDFVVAPGADPRVIMLAFAGAQKIVVEENGDLLLRTKGGDVRMLKPFVYQESESGREAVACRYLLKDKHQVGFEVAPYDRSKTLVIDPILSYSTYLGGSDFDEGRSIAVDSSGNAYITGRTGSFNFPAGKDAFSSTYANSYDVFVTKLNPEGSAFVYSTYIGGNSEDLSYDIAIDSAGNAYIAGSTASSNFPTTPGAYDTVLDGSFSRDGFITKLNSTGTALVYSTLLGTSNTEECNGIAVDSGGNAYVAGYTGSSTFPTTAGAFQTLYAGSTDGFISKLNDTGTALVYSTFLGGSTLDQAKDIAVDSGGNAYVTGNTTSATFPTTAGAFQTLYGGSTGCCSNPQGDVFVTKMNPTGTAQLYSTYMGGSSDEGGSGLAVAPSGEVYLTGSTTSLNFPTTPGALRVGNGGIAKSTDGSNSWEATNNGLTHSTINVFAINPSDPMTLYAGTSSGGVFKSTNGGANWSPSNSGLTVLNIQSLAIDPVTPSIVYLGTLDRGVFKSTNSGASWRAINTGQNGTNIFDLKIDPAAHTTIYAGTSNRVYKTTNSGASWTAIHNGLNQASSVNVLAINPINTATLYAGFFFGGLSRTTDGGANWSNIGLFQTTITALAIDPVLPSTLYAGTGNGLLKSTDGGDSWNGVNNGLSNRVINTLNISPGDSLTIYAGTGNGVFKSTNGGSSWSAANSGLAGASVNALVIDPLTPATIYSGSVYGGSDAFVSRFNPTATALVYSTFLGGSSSENSGGGNFDQGNAIAIDSSGNAYVAGYTTSRNFPTTKGAFQSVGCCSDSEGFVSKLTAAGTTLTYSTYLGGNSSDQCFGIAVDSSASAYVTGGTSSQNFPVTEAAFQSILNSFSSDAFISKFVAAPSLSADLAITVTPSVPSATVSTSIRYDITVTNNGPEPVTSIVISDDLPSSLIFNGCGGPTNCFQAGNSITFTIGSLDVDASVTVSIFAVVNCSVADNTMIQNSAAVDSSALDLNPVNNSATASITAINPTTSITPTSQSYSSGGGSGFIEVNRGANCNWTSTSNDSWITITHSSNCCNGFVNYTVAANPGAARTGTITVAGQTFTVNQATGICSYGLALSSFSYSASATTGNLAVTAPAGCNWQAISDSSWLQITSGSGSGNGNVIFNVEANNTGSARNGTINVQGQIFTVYQGIAFNDVLPGHPFYDVISRLSARGITSGCGGGNYCPDAGVTREQMAAFILRARGEFNPPVPGSQRFNDVPPSNPFYSFIDRIADLQITAGCSTSPPLYCPSGAVSREQMAAFIIRALHDPGYTPPPPGSQRFNDVPPSSPFYGFIEEMAVRNITSGCSAIPPLYCPSDTVTRAQMAAFLLKAFNL